MTIRSVNREPAAGDERRYVPGCDGLRAVGRDGGRARTVGALGDGAQFVATASSAGPRA